MSIKEKIMAIGVTQEGFDRLVDSIKFEPLSPERKVALHEAVMQIKEANDKYEYGGVSHVKINNLDELQDIAGYTLAREWDG